MVWNELEWIAIEQLHNIRSIWRSRFAGLEICPGHTSFVDSLTAIDIVKYWSIAKSPFMVLLSYSCRRYVLPTSMFVSSRATAPSARSAANLDDTSSMHTAI